MIKKEVLKIGIIISIVEWVIAIFVVMVVNNYLLNKENELKLSVISTQKETLESYVNAYEELEKTNLEYKAITYMDKEEKMEINENRTYLGTFKITHYCACKKCCGSNAQGITASGKRVEENKTIAVDPKVIKLGSQVYIEGYGEMEAQDTGSAVKGNHIDVYIADHQKALQMGVVYKDVYLLNKGDK